MIKVLDQHTIDKIAAGEVIERPSSVVKELVENSVDAHASRITVEITDGGTSMIRVTDNGDGIDSEDVRKAYLSHATSKLDNVDDLLAINSLGFRGEALSTIAAVSKVEMITKTRQALTGIKYEIEGGKEIGFSEIGAPDGTTIISRNIFFNTPARLKFLKTNMTEGSYINDLMVHIALANPDIAVKLISGGKTIVDTQGDGRLKETIYSLYGKDITKGLLEVNYEDENIKITGYIGKPYLSKGNRSFENYYVNKRFIKNAVVTRAIEEAYKTHIMQHKFPFTALFIEVPTYMVDVNVHPAKREFRFDDEKGLFHAVFHAVKDALTDKVMIPDMESDYKVAPVIKQEVSKFNSPFNKPDTINTTTSGSYSFDEFKKSSPGNDSGFLREESSFGESKTSESKTSESKSDDSNNIDSENNNAENVSSDNITVGTSDSVSGTTGSSTTVSHGSSSTHSSGSSGANTFQRPSSGTNSFSILESLLPKEYMDKINSQDSNQSSDKNGLKDGSIESSKESSFDSSVESSRSVSKTESFEQMEMSEARFLSEEAKGHHKIIGQVFKTYWITEYDGSMYIMDQHAAHEKVNYETFLAEFKERRIHSQNLFPPEVIVLSSAEKTAVLDNVDYLKQYGFEIEDFGGNDIKLSTMPANLIGLNGRDVFTELASYLADGISDAKKEVTEDIFVRKLATMGCKAAIKGNQEISEYEIKDLLDKLMKLKDPYTCPHGRPTLIKMTKDELDKKFKRIVE